MKERAPDTTTGAAAHPMRPHRARGIRGRQAAASAGGWTVLQSVLFATASVIRQGGGQDPVSTQNGDSAMEGKTPLAQLQIVPRRSYQVAERMCREGIVMPTCSP
ncbi:MAG: hypothetical protein EA339_15025 [Rhodobacteraceae bacterium]|nr:MAG: hypothetical protein EA339_15025 [Paracoccaceae bacterium]